MSRPIKDSTDSLNTKISVQLTAEERNQLVRLAKDNDLTISQFVRRAIREYIDNNIIDF